MPEPEDSFVPTSGQMQRDIAYWQTSVWGHLTPESGEWKLAEEVQEFFAAELLSDKMLEAADIMIVLYGWAARVGFDLDTAVRAKFHKAQLKYPAGNPDNAPPDKREKVVDFSNWNRSYLSDCGE